MRTPSPGVEGEDEGQTVLLGEEGNGRGLTIQGTAAGRKLSVAKPMMRPPMSPPPSSASMLATETAGGASTSSRRPLVHMPAWGDLTLSMAKMKPRRHSKHRSDRFSPPPPDHPPPAPDPIADREEKEDEGEKGLPPTALLGDDDEQAKRPSPTGEEGPRRQSKARERLGSLTDKPRTRRSSRDDATSTSASTSTLAMPTQGVAPVEEDGARHARRGSKGDLRTRLEGRRRNSQTPELTSEGGSLLQAANADASLMQPSVATKVVDVVPTGRAVDPLLLQSAVQVRLGLFVLNPSLESISCLYVGSTKSCTTLYYIILYILCCVYVYMSAVMFSHSCDLLASM